MKVYVPPIKCQGIKSKIVPTIRRSLEWNGSGMWIEPFMGSGVVGFNVLPKVAIFADSNPHLINFYNSLASGKLDGFKVRAFLEKQGEKLSDVGDKYYYEVRKRFNKHHDPLDFLFLNRSCFNGVIRFNQKGGFNVPFGHKPNRFSKAYITKIVNQFDYVYISSKQLKWIFKCQDFKDTLSELSGKDFVYCDPPYVGRHVDYYDSWDEQLELELFNVLDNLTCKFILSTWHSNIHRENQFIKTLWSKFTILTKKHFYHVGAKEKNRKSMIEALVMNYTAEHTYEDPIEKPYQHTLFEKIEDYQALTNRSTCLS
jgi:DNA adenine methylase